MFGGMTTNPSENAVKEISNAVMRGTALLIKQSGKHVADYAQACEAIKSEIRAFLFGAEYEDERICLMRRSVHEGYIVASVCAGALGKINFA